MSPTRKKLFILILIVIALIAFGFVVFEKNKNFGKEKTPADLSSSTEVASASVVALSTSTNFTGSLNTLPGSLDAPQQIQVETAQIPVGSVRLEISDSGFSPKEFTVLANQPVTLAIAAQGSNTHVFLFPNAALMGLTMMIAGGETKIINFTAPAPGDYSFRDDIPTFRANTVWEATGEGRSLKSQQGEAVAEGKDVPLNLVQKAQKNF